MPRVEVSMQKPSQRGTLLNKMRYDLSNRKKEKEIMEKTTEQKILFREQSGTWTGILKIKYLVTLENAF